MRLILEELKSRIDRREVGTGIIDVSTIESIVADLSTNEEDLAQESLQLFDAFHSPKLYYDEKLHQYKVLDDPKIKVLAPMESRATMYRERLVLTQQRLLRSDLFTLRSRKGQGRVDSDELSTVESLLGSSGSKILLGFLTQPEEGQWYLEDLTGSIRLDLSQAQTYPLLYTEGSIVVAQGARSHLNTFVVQVMGLPPAEDRETTLKALNMVDTFSSHAQQQSQHHLQMQHLEEETDQLVVILADMHLDKPLVLEKFLTVLQGFDGTNCFPLYVLMGSFLSQPLYYASGGKTAISNAFQALADTIAQVPGQRDNAKFLLVPGPLDAGSNVALPRRGLPAALTAPLTETLAHVSFGSNPCRLRCFTQELVLYRNDLIRKMQRHLVVPMVLPHQNEMDKDEREEETEIGQRIEDHQRALSQTLSQPHAKVPSTPTSTQQEIPDTMEQLVESLLDQAHLCPLPAVAAPVHWEMDHVLRLVPLPHLLVLADHTDQFSYEYKGCRTINPGTFSSDFSFIVYYLASKEVQFSRVP